VEAEIDDHALDRFTAPFAIKFLISPIAIRIRLEKLGLLHRAVPHRAEALSCVRNAVEEIKKIAPIPNLECKPSPAVLRHCSAKLTKRLSFGIDDTSQVKAKVLCMRFGAILLSVD
jgi:hypothetical protein